MVEQLKPDVVLLDLDMPVMNGREALAQILSINPQLTVIMLTVSEDSDDLTECMRMGAKGFLLKNINADFLLESIRKAVDGDNVFSPEMTSRFGAIADFPFSFTLRPPAGATDPARNGNLGLPCRRTQQ